MTVTAHGKATMWNEEDDAQASAVATWSEAVQRQASIDYAAWDNAQNKSLICAPDSQSTIECTANATPCKP